MSSVLASLIVTLEKSKAIHMSNNTTVKRKMNDTLELKLLVSGTCICKLSGEGAIAYCTVESCLGFRLPEAIMMQKLSKT